MSDSHKARHGTNCKHWKDTVLASRSQKRAWTKTKQIQNQRKRTNAKLALKEKPDDA